MTPSGDGGARRALAPTGRRGRWHRCKCGRPIPEEVRRCSSRTSPEFAPTWARDTRRRLFINLEQLKLSVMFSVTAPGADLYPFDHRFCSHPPSQRCSGPLGCRVAPEVAAAFNAMAGKWWSELHRAAKTRADRACGFKGKLAARVWEKQKRGMAHLHGVISVESPAHVEWAEAYITALRELAPRCGFGFVDGWQENRPEILARGASRRVPLKLLRWRPWSKDGDHRERPRRRPTPARRICRSRLDRCDRVHGAESQDRSSALGGAQRALRLSPADA